MFGIVMIVCLWLNFGWIWGVLALVGYAVDVIIQGIAKIIKEG